jgi:hypothetical protein
VYTLKMFASLILAAQLATAFAASKCFTPVQGEYNGDTALGVLDRLGH